jgi:hypothetical protein
MLAGQGASAIARLVPGRLSGPFPQRAFVGGVHPDHLLGQPSFVGVVEHRQPRHGTAERGMVGVGRDAESLVPAELGVLDHDLQAIGRQRVQGHDEQGGLLRDSGAAPGPVVDLTGREAGEAGEAGLGDAGAGEKGVEFGVQERSHPLFHIEMSSIPEAIAPSLTQSRRDNTQYRSRLCRLTLALSPLKLASRAAFGPDLRLLRHQNPHFGALAPLRGQLPQFDTPCYAASSAFGRTKCALRQRKRAGQGAENRAMSAP